MNRRGFFGMLAAGAVALAVNTRLGQSGVAIVTSRLTVEMITREAIRVLQKNSEFMASLHANRAVTDYLSRDTGTVRLRSAVHNGPRSAGFGQNE